MLPIRVRNSDKIFPEIPLSKLSNIFNRTKCTNISVLTLIFYETENNKIE